MTEMTPHEEWVARTMLARGFEPFEVEDALGLARYEPAHPPAPPKVRRRPTGSANPVTHDEVRRMAEMRARGMTYRQIGTAVGRDRSTVGYWMKKMEEECADTPATKTPG